MPCVRGTRIPIAVILGSLAEGLTPDQVLDHFPHLALEDVYATLTYAAVLTQQTNLELPPEP